MTWQHRLILAAFLAVGLAAPATAADLPAWTAKIRGDHPRLFFNTDTWPAVRDRALGAELAWYRSVKARVDRLSNDLAAEQPRELGPEAAWAAFVYRVTGDRRYLELARTCLDASLRFYDDCYEQRKSVNWYSTSRVHAVMAWDWLYNDLDEAERGADVAARDGRRPGAEGEAGDLPGEHVGL